MPHRNPLQVNPNARGPRYVYERPRARLVSNLLRVGLLVLAVGCLIVVSLPLLARLGMALPGVPPPSQSATVTASATLRPTAQATPTPEPSATPGPSPTETSRAEFQYTVVEGDSLYSIALANDLTIQQLAAANGKTSDTLAIGEVLIIPPPDYQLPTATSFPPDLQPGTSLDHVIRPGETLAEIAAAYLTTEESILAANEDVIIDPTNLPAGSVIVVRYGLVTPTVSAPAASDTPAG